MQSSRCLRLTALTLLCVFAAFSGWAAGAPEEEVDVIELVLWHAGPSVQIEIMQAAIEEYNTIQDDVRIVWQERPPSVAAIATALAGGEGPDLMYYWQNVPWEFGTDSYYPLNEFILDPEIGLDPDDYVAAAREAVHYMGEIRAVPIDMDMGGVRFNIRLLDEAGLDPNNPPQDWYELTEWAEQLTIRDDDGEVIQWGMEAVVVDWILQEVMLNNGGDWVNDDLTEYAVPEESLVEALEWLDYWVNEIEVMPAPSGVTWVGAPDAGEQAFAEERAALQIGSHSVGGVLEVNPDLEGQLGVFPIPAGPSQVGPAKVSVGFHGFHVMEPAEHPREAYLFAKWFVENYGPELSWPVRRLPVHTDPELIAQYEEDFRINQMLPRLEHPVRNFHVFPGRLDVRTEEPGMVERVLMGAATAEEAVRDFKAHAARVFEQMEPEMRELRERAEFVW